MKRKIGKKLRRALKIREEQASKRPRFIRTDSWFIKRLNKGKWRAPKGQDNKIRLQKKGFPKKVKIGYRGVKLARGLHPSGYEEVLIYRKEDLYNLDPRRHAIRIAGNVGRKKRTEIISEANRLGLYVLNPGGK